MTHDQSEPPAPRPPQMVDLFAGPGGLDVAAHWLDLSVVGIEWDKDACATRRAAGLGTIQGDVRELGPDDFPGATILTGGPPCQTYTVAGTGAGRRALDQVLAFVHRMADPEDDVTADLTALEDERTGLVLEPLRWALEAHRKERPYEAIVLEQVPSVLPVWEAVAKVLNSIGYKTVCGVLHAEEFGVPQTRRRAILIAHRKYAPRLPRPTHRRFRKRSTTSDHQSSLLSGENSLRPCETLGGTLERPGPFVVVSNYGTGGNPKARGRRTCQEPAATVTGKVSRNRLETPDGVDLGRLQLSEAGQLQTFPADYPWSGSHVAQQIGNAIPPRLAAHVLAAALGRELDAEFLDLAVQSRWKKIDSRSSVLEEAVEKAATQPPRTPDENPTNPEVVATQPSAPDAFSVAGRAPRIGQCMNMEHIARRLRRFRDERDWHRHHSLRNLAIALNVEASELLELIQWVDDDQLDTWIGKEQHRAAVTDEIADVFIYLTYLVDHLGIDLETAVLSKIERNADRFPVAAEPTAEHEKQEAQA